MREVTTADLYISEDPHITNVLRALDYPILVAGRWARNRPGRFAVFALTESLQMTLNGIMPRVYELAQNEQVDAETETAITEAIEILKMDEVGNEAERIEG